MQLQRYHDYAVTAAGTHSEFRTALVAREGHKWMTLLVISDGQLKLIRRPLTDACYLTPLQTNERKAKASLRRLARKRGTSRKIRAAIAELVQS